MFTKRITIAAITFFSMGAIFAATSVEAFAQAAPERRVVKRVTKKRTTTTKRQVKQTTNASPTVVQGGTVRYPVPRRAYQAPVVYRTYQRPTVVYRRSYPTVYEPNFTFYSGNPQVYRYVRRPRYVWMPSPYVEQPRQQPPQNVYIYNNTEYVVQDQPDPVSPELDCPRDAEMQRSTYQSWCATARGTKHGPYVVYYTNGQVRTEGYYEYGKKNGAWVEYFQDGGIRSEGAYLDGHRSGTWINYNKKGEEVTTVFYN